MHRSVHLVCPNGGVVTRFVHLLCPLVVPMTGQLWRSATSFMARFLKSALTIYLQFAYILRMFSQYLNSSAACLPVPISLKQ